jgi:hypothetical protein
MVPGEALGADGDVLVVVLEELLAVLAGLVPVELVGGQTVRIHLPHVAVATGAQLGDGFLVVGALEIVGDVRGFVRRFRVTAVTINAAQSGLAMGAGAEFLLLFFVTGEAGHIGCPTGNSRQSENGHNARAHCVNPPLWHSAQFISFHVSPMSTGCSNVRPAGLMLASFSLVPWAMMV